MSRSSSKGTYSNGGQAEFLLPNNLCVHYFFTFTLAPAFKHHDGSNCECFIELCSTTRNHLELFKDDRVNPFITKKVEAMFRCLEAMLNYEGGCV